MGDIRFKLLYIATRPISFDPRVNVVSRIIATTENRIGIVGKLLVGGRKLMGNFDIGMRVYKVYGRKIKLRYPKLNAINVIGRFLITFTVLFSEVKYILYCILTGIES